MLKMVRNIYWRFSFFVDTTVRIITSASDDVQRVPNISVISPPSSDFMEMEVSSVQSSSDSLASETSETSYRER